MRVGAGSRLPVLCHGLRAIQWRRYRGPFSLNDVPGSHCAPSGLGLLQCGRVPLLPMSDRRVSPRGYTEPLLRLAAEGVSRLDEDGCESSSDHQLIVPSPFEGEGMEKGKVLRLKRKGKTSFKPHRYIDPHQTHRELVCYTKAYKGLHIQSPLRQLHGGQNCRAIMS